MSEQTSIGAYQHDCLEAKFEGGTLILSFNRPDAMNAINAEMETAFYGALAAAEMDDAVKVVLIRGNGRVFSAGHDYNAVLQEIDNPPDEPVLINGKPWMRTGRLLPSWEFSKPLVAAVHKFVGPHANAILMTCDVVIATEDTRFSIEAAKNNPTGVPFGSYNLLPFYFPLRAMKKIWLGAGWFDAEQALASHYVQRVVPEEELLSAALAQCKYLEKLSGQHFRDNKKGIHKMYEIWGLVQMETLGHDPYAPTGDDLAKFEEHLETLRTEGPAANARKRDAGDDEAVTKL